MTSSTNYADDIDDGEYDDNAGSRRLRLLCRCRHGGRLHSRWHPVAIRRPARDSRRFCHCCWIKTAACRNAAEKKTSISVLDEDAVADEVDIVDVDFDVVRDDDVDDGAVVVADDDVAVVAVVFDDDDVAAVASLSQKWRR